MGPRLIQTQEVGKRCWEGGGGGGGKSPSKGGKTGRTLVKLTVAEKTREKRGQRKQPGFAKRSPNKKLEDCPHTKKKGGGGGGVVAGGGLGRDGKGRHDPNW